ncbi:MAG: MopE-related protein, partial [Myxococcales bacterium]|nr:MopE-related protein [Myxococcales bacterium]
MARRFGLVLGAVVTLGVVLGACGGGERASSCGDGIVDPSERCDDGNDAGGDGCASVCEPEAGYTCVGEPSVCTAAPVDVCGDFSLAAPEECDDGNTLAADGCDGSCLVEAGYECSGSPSVCVLISCGDGNLDAGEGCDDGNRLSGDGCSDTCAIEDCRDEDGDGFLPLSCGGLDCDDTNRDINPDAFEICTNGIDEDCDGVDQTATGMEICGNDIDDDCDPSTPDLFDGDGDGSLCDVDCDDTRGGVRPGGMEICGNGIDDDCDPATGDLWDADADGASCDLDCDDTDPAIGADPSGSCPFHYFEDFETGPGGWTASGAASSWEHGAPAGTLISGASSGSNAWVTNLSGDYNDDELSYLTSP